MSEHSVRVVISGHGDQQVQLRLQSPTSDRPVVVQVASLEPLTLPGAAAPRIPTPPPSISLELRWSEPPPAAPEPPKKASEAPLANAWALSQKLRERQAAEGTGSAPRRRGVRVGTPRVGSTRAVG